LEAKESTPALDRAISKVLYGEPSNANATGNLAVLKSMIREKLPGWAWSVGEKGDGIHYAYVNNNQSHFSGLYASPNPRKRWYEHRAASPELAGCAALLYALADLAEEQRAPALNPVNEDSDSLRLWSAEVTLRGVLGNTIRSYYLAKSARRVPEVMLAEDLHNIDRESLEPYLDHRREAIWVRSLEEVPKEDHHFVFFGQGDECFTIEEFFAKNL
jgi:hypothetical protein